MEQEIKLTTSKEQLKQVLSLTLPPFDESHSRRDYPALRISIRRNSRCTKQISR